jgi:hypothetical protein
VQELEDSKTKLAEEAEELEQRVDKAKDAAAELQVRSLLALLVQNNTC